MFEIYLISILDGVKWALLLLIGLAIFATIACGIWYMNIYDELPYSKYDYEYEDIMKKLQKIKRKIKIFFSLFLFLLIVSSIIPSTKQAYLIYGIGSTVDYLKDNETAKQLPDKAVIALDKWLNSVSDTTKIK